MLSELAEDGQSRNNYSFNAEMTFYQAGDKVNSLSGNGVEADYADDGVQWIPDPEVYLVHR